MNMMYYFLFFSGCIMTMESKIIKNMNVPSCRNCIHYKPSLYSKFSSDYTSKCNYFGTKDIQTDEIFYDYTSSCRNDESKCGLNGIYFEKEPNIGFKIFLHNSIHYLPFSMYAVFIIASLSMMSRR